jgi:hypothetical protein
MAVVAVLNIISARKKRGLETGIVFIRQVPVVTT